MVLFVKHKFRKKEAIHPSDEVAESKEWQFKDRMTVRITYRACL